MDHIGPSWTKWTEIDRMNRIKWNGPKWTKKVQIDQRTPNGLKQTKVNQMDRIGLN